MKKLNSGIGVLPQGIDAAFASCLGDSVNNKPKVSEKTVSRIIILFFLRSNCEIGSHWNSIIPMAVSNI